MPHRYISLAEFHRRRGDRLVPPSWRPPRLWYSDRQYRLAADDPDPGYTDWIQKVADYLQRLDRETRKQLQRLDHPVKLLNALARKAEQFWFQHDKLQKILEARGGATDQLDTIANDLAANLAISNEYLDAVIETADRAQSRPAKQALELVLDITHADEATI